MHSWAARLKEKFCTNDDGEMKVSKTEMNWTWTVKLRHKGEEEMNLVLAAQINKLRSGFVKGRRTSDRNSDVQRFYNIWYCKRSRTRDNYKNVLSLMYNVSPYIVTSVRPDMPCAGDVCCLYVLVPDGGPAGGTTLSACRDTVIV